MDEQFLFWYPVVIETQPDFEGHNHTKEVLCKGHIICGGRLLCREAKEATKNRYGAKKEKIVALRVPRVKVCEDCLRIYKTKEDSAYAAWIEGKPKALPTKSLELIKT